MLPLLTAKGYGAIVPELLGYGETDKPEEVKDYAYKKQSDQLVALLDEEGVNNAIIVGHDLGQYLIGQSRRRICAN